MLKPVSVNPAPNHDKRVAWADASPDGRSKSCGEANLGTPVVLLPSSVVEAGRTAFEGLEVGTRWCALPEASMVILKMAVFKRRSCLSKSVTLAGADMRSWPGGDA